MAYISVIKKSDRSNARFVEECRLISFIPRIESKEHTVDGNGFSGIMHIRKELSNEIFDGNFYEDNNFVVFIDGYIATKKKKNYAKYALDGFLNDKSRFIAELNGEYNIIIYNKQEDSIDLFNDRFAARPIFFSQKAEELIISNEIKTLLKFGDRAINKEGLLEFMLFFHNVGDWTIYENVKALKPASHLKFRGASINISTYWSLTYDRVQTKVKNLANEAKQLLSDSAELKYRDRNKTGLGLSGGLDSRLIAATIPDHLKNSMFVRTYGLENSSEMKIARELFKKLKFSEHFTHEPIDISFHKLLFPAVWRTEGQIPFYGLKSLTQHELLIDKMYFKLPGHFGDVLTGKSLRPFMFKPMNRESFVDVMFKHTIKLNLNQEIKQVLRPEFYNSHIDSVKGHFRESYKTLKANNNWDLCSVWDLQNRQPRFTFHGSQVDAYLQETIKLFTDYQYVDLMTTLPLRLRFGQSFYKYMIAVEFPDIADIPNGNTGVVLKKSILGNYMDLFSVYRTGMRNRKRRSSTKVSGSYANTRQDKELKQYLLDFMDDSAFPGDWLDKKGMHHIIEEHYSGRVDHNYTIGILATFIAAFDMFITNNYSAVPERAQPLKSN